MSIAIDAAGERHHRLTAVRRLPNRGKQPWWLFRCDCGRETEAQIGSVRSGGTKSCGCLIGEANRARLLKHGYHGSPTYIAWSDAKSRCHNPKDKVYHHYGARGIVMCDRWRNSFEAFLEDVGERPNPRLSIDRIDNDGHYEPGNCRWATKAQQIGNIRGRTRIKYEGETYSIKEFATLMRVNYDNLYYRVRKAGHDPLRAVEALRSGRWRRIA